MAFIVVLAVALGAADASAQGAADASVTSACEPAEAIELRDHLTSQSSKADTWNLAWRITFTAAAVGTLAVGLANPFPSLQQGLFASSGKATIGALARWILPLRIHVPAETGDACADVAALRKEIRRVAKRERSLFFMGHIGGIAVNLAGAGYVWYQDSLGKGLLSIAVGYPIGLLSNYTMPRGTWKLDRQRAWTVYARPREDGWVVTVGGAF